MQRDSGVSGWAMIQSLSGVGLVSKVYLCSRVKVKKTSIRFSSNLSEKTLRVRSSF